MDRTQRLSCTRRFLPLLLLAFCLHPVISRKLENIPQKELQHLIKTEKFVVVLFSKQNCAKCLDYESELAMTREVMVDSLNAWVVKSVSNPMIHDYNPSPDPVPSVVFFRNSVPFLYHGQPDEDDFLSTFQRSQEPLVRHLNDENFEHLTQAGTGATTGDWLVMFTRDTSEESRRLEATWEAVALELNNRINVALVNKGTDGGVTGRRFEVSDVPAFLLFRHGKVYKYELDSFTLQNFVDFATDFYRNSKATTVPPPKSPFDDLVEMIVEMMKENPQVVKLGSIIFTVVLLLGFLIIKFGGGGKKKPIKKVKTVKKKAS